MWSTRHWCCEKGFVLNTIGFATGIRGFQGRSRPFVNGQNFKCSKSRTVEIFKVKYQYLEVASKTVDVGEQEIMTVCALQHMKQVT
uniref:Uncharacterized protein n=1 Tax=Trichuris muris TaxID=70415 RepID=A0A5S6QS45_TRIMR